MARQDSFHPKLAAYWGLIQQGVSARMTTAQLWNTVKQAAQTENADLTGVRIFDMNNIRGLAASIRNQSQNFMNAPSNASIDNTMISQNINSRPLLDQNEVQIYQVRFEHLVTTGGEQSSVWRTIQYTMDMPTTKDALLADIEANAIALANNYNVGHAGIGQIQISSV